MNENIGFTLGFRFFKLMLHILIFSQGMLTSESNASDAISDLPITVYYEYLVFTEAHKNQDPQNAASASNLLLLDELSSQVTVEFMPTARLAVNLNTSTAIPVCALFKLANSERVSKYYFSLPVGLLQTHRFYSRAGMGALQPSLLNEQGAIKQISTLFDIYPEAKLMLWDNISQGDFIDAALKHVPEKNKERIQGLTSYGSLGQMISRERADFAIMLPHEIAHFENKFHPLNLLAYRIDGVEPVSTMHMMCNKNNASKRFLKTVDTALRELYKTPEFVSANTFKVATEEVPFVLQAIERLQNNTE